MWCVFETDIKRARETHRQTADTKRDKHIDREKYIFCKSLIFSGRSIKLTKKKETASF